MVQLGMISRGTGIISPSLGEQSAALPPVLLGAVPPVFMGAQAPG